MPHLFTMYRYATHITCNTLYFVVELFHRELVLLDMCLDHGYRMLGILSASDAMNWKNFFTLHMLRP